MSPKGTIVLMGSGELTATMVEVHKEMLAGIGPAARAAFVDTPAGFQLNADQISAKAVDYFRTRVGRVLSVASIRSKSEAEDVNALAALRQADFILIGPGSPTYAVRQWHGTPVPEILARRIESGGCLVAASAAALTVGRFTLPVYEIYKVGEAPHWVEGIDVLGRFGLNLAVVPHWNNAEGGNHDTRFCFMGEPRFRRLEALLPPEVTVCGLDEHTACIIDLAAGKARIRGIGGVTLRRAGAEQVFRKGESFPLAFLEGRGIEDKGGVARPAGPAPAPEPPDRGDLFWQEVHALDRRFQAGLDGRDPAAMTAAILELDGFIWQRARDLESEEAISQARESLRDWIALAGSAMSPAPPEALNCLAPVVEEMLALRRHFRSRKQWREADAIRDGLRRAGVAVDDTPEGSRWRVLGPDEERRTQDPERQGAAHD